MSRFDNYITWNYLYRLARVIVENFIASYDKEPNIIVLDFDDTEVKVHGDQQLALFNNYFDDYCFVTLYVYEGLSGKLITTILRRDKRANSKTIPFCGIFKRLVSCIRCHWPNTIIIFRDDSYFTYPEVMERVDEKQNVYFCTGLTANCRAEEKLQSHIERVKKLYNT